MISDITFFTVKEVAAILHTSESWVRTLIRSGSLPAKVHIARKRHKRLIVFEDDLKAYIYTQYCEEYWPGAKRPERLRQKSKSGT